MLRAIGADEDLAHSSIRFGIGRFTTEEEVDYTADKCIKVVDTLREMRYLHLCIMEMMVRFLTTMYYFQSFVGNGAGRN